MSLQNEVQSAVDALFNSKEYEDKKPTKNLMARLTREWEAFKASAIALGFDPEEHYLYHTTEDLWEVAARHWIYTRNHEGSGFWDGRWDKEMGNKLTELSNTFGEIEIYSEGQWVSPYSIVYIKKIATHCYIKFKDCKQKSFNYGEHPSEYLIKLPEIDNKWRRIYSICYSNNSSDWLYIKGERFCLGDILSGIVTVNSEPVRIEVY